MDKIGAGVAVPRRVRQIRYGHPLACAPSLMASSARPIAEPLGSVPLPRRLQAPVSPAQAPGADLLCSAAAVMTERLPYGAVHLVTATSAPAYISGKTALRPALKYYTPKTLRFVAVDITSGPK